MNWTEDKSYKRNLEIDHTFIRYIIKTKYISIGETIRVVKHPDSDVNLIYSRLVGMNEEYMFKKDIISKYVSKIHNILNFLIDKKEVFNGENSIISSRFVKNKLVIETCFISYAREQKLNKLLS